jgi:hypothetical protein
MGHYYNPNIITDGLILSLDPSNIRSYPGSGTALNDLSGKDYNGTLVNSPTYDSGSFLFNGSTQNITMPAAASPVSTQITISVWSKLTSPSSPPGSAIFNSIDASSNRIINIHNPWSDNTVYWDCGNSGGASYDRITYGPLTLAEKTGWRNWCFTKNSTSGVMTIYLDGVAVSTASGLTRTFGAANTFKIGSSSPNIEYYAGNIANVYVYNRVLTAAEILQNYNTLKKRFV